MNKKEKRSLLRNGAFQSLLASLACILIGLLVGYIVLLLINPAGAGKAIISILKNFMYYPTQVKALQYFGTTLVKTAPLLLCSLSVLFAYLLCAGMESSMVCLHSGGGGRWRCAGGNFRSFKGILQCKRGNFLYHAELDLSVCGEYAALHGEGSIKPVL